MNDAAILSVALAKADASQGRSITMADDVIIHLPIEKVAERIADPVSMASYHPAFTGAEYLTGKEPATGNTLRWYFRMGKRRGYYDEVIARADRNGFETINIGGQNISPFDLAVTRLIFQPENSKTHVRLEVTVSLKGAWRRFLFHRLMASTYRKYFPKILSALKDYCEG